MPKAKRNIGQEILEGIRQIKRGEQGRTMKVPSVTSRVVAVLQVPHERCC